MSVISKHVRAVFFDLDETLLDDDRSMREAVTRTCQALARHHKHIDSTKLETTYLRVAEEWWLGSSSVPRTSESGSTAGRDIRIEVWGKAFNAYGLTDKDLAVEAADIYTSERRAGYCLFPDASQALQALHPRYTLGVITNGPAETQREKLHVTGIVPYLHTFVISGELGVGKPDPGIFLKALESAKVTPEEAVHVGDSLTSDVAGARGIGMYAVWINRTKTARPQNAPDPDLEIHSLHALVSLLISDRLL